jgi:hypothetical protein
VPTSVLLAVLAAAGLLALAPALVRRYDATERLVAERALSTARVLTRAGAQYHGRPRTIPGRRPINPPRVLAQQVTSAAAFAAGAAVFTAGVAVFSASTALSAAAGYEPLVQSRAARRSRRSRVDVPSRVAYRRRRALLSLTLLVVVEIMLAAFVARVLWITVSVTSFLLVAYVVHLRNRALIDQRRRRAEARYAEWVAAQQAAVRREQARRAAARRELLERHLSARDEARKAELRGRPYSSWAASR